MTAPRGPAPFSVSALDAAWRDKHAWLAGFVTRQGRLPHSNDGRAGHTWMMEQKRAHAAGQLRREQIELLEQVPGWSWEAPLSWEQSAVQLERFIRVHGRVPLRRLPTEMRLGHWLAQQLSRPKYERLSVERRRRLDTIVAAAGPRHSGNRAVFDRNKAAMLRYVAVHGHALPDPDEVFDGVRLWKWQRHLAHSPLAAATRQELEALPGWIWDADEAWWQARLRRLTAAAGGGPVNEHNPALKFEVPAWTWALQQRQKHADGALSTAQVTALAALPGWVWEPTRNRQRKQLLPAVRLLAEHGKLNDREQVVAHCRLLCPTPVAVSELARQEGVTPERVRQVEQQLLDRAHLVAVYLAARGDSAGGDLPAALGALPPRTRALLRAGGDEWVQLAELPASTFRILVHTGYRSLRSLPAALSSAQPRLPARVVRDVRDLLTRQAPHLLLEAVRDPAPVVPIVNVASPVVPVPGVADGDVSGYPELPLPATALPAPTVACLMRGGYLTVRDVAAADERDLKDLRWFGSKKLTDVHQMLHDLRAAA